jgi:phage-related protein
LGKIEYNYVYYEEADGTGPVQTYLAEKCNNKERARWFKTLKDWIPQFNPQQPPPHHIIHSVEELTQITFGNHRCLTMLEGTCFVLLHAFRKKGRKTPEKEKNTARNNYRKHKEKEKEKRKGEKY